MPSIVLRTARLATPLVHLLAMFASFIPEREFNAIQEPKFVVDGAKVICDDISRRAHRLGNLSVLEPLRYKLDDSPLLFVGDTGSVAISSKHNQAASLFSRPQSSCCKMPVGHRFSIARTPFFCPRLGPTTSPLPAKNRSSIR